MKKWLLQLASLRVAVVLLVLLLVALSMGTIVESAKGTATAGATVYYAWWFLALEAAFAINVLASIVVHWPWGARRTGFLLTHSALLVILAGAAVSYFTKTEGRLGLWEGQSDDAIVQQDSESAPEVRHPLPFAVKLDDFQIDYYPGTMRPAMFRSLVQIVEPDGTTIPADIHMNHPLHYKGWSFFQSSYRQENGREATILAVSRDPGQPIVFFGYFLLVGGMIVVLATRISQARAKDPKWVQLQSEPRKVARRAAAALALAAALSATGASAAPAPAWPEGARADVLRALPVQHDGRVMPLDTLAREAVWNVTGRRAWAGQDPVITVLGWTFDPQSAAMDPVVKLGSPALAAAAGLPPATTHVSFVQAVRNPTILKFIQDAHDAESRDVPRHGLLKDAEGLEQRLLWMKGFLDGQSIRPVPTDDPHDRWDVAHAHGAAELAYLLKTERPSAWPPAKSVDREITYNAVRPTRLAWWILGGALVLSIVGWNGKRRIVDVLAFVGLLAGFGVMTWGIAARWAIAGRIPASNMYESLLFLAWGVGLFAVVAFAVVRNRLVVLNANAMAALTMLLTDVLPIDGFVHPVAPVLSGTPWLAIHVPIIMVSYAVLALGVVIAHMQIGFQIFARQKGELIAKMNELLYWYTMIGSILLIAGILTGSIWAASSWGRYWGWDPKEVWSLVAFLAYLAILHARWDRWIGPFGVAAISIVAFQTILMTYLGVNFVLASGMHSYGFGQSSVVNWMFVVALAEVAFIVAGWLAHRASLRPTLTSATA